MQIGPAETKDLGNELNLTWLRRRGIFGCNTHSPAHRRTWPPWAAPYQWPAWAPAVSPRCKPNCSCCGQRQQQQLQLQLRRQLQAATSAVAAAFCNTFVAVYTLHLWLLLLSLISAIVFHLIHVAARVFDWIIAPRLHSSSKREFSSQFSPPSARPIWQ